MGYVPNPANEEPELSNTEDSGQKSLPNTEDSFGQSRYKKDNYIKDKDYKEEEKKKEKEKEVNITPRGVTGGNNTEIEDYIIEKEIVFFMSVFPKGFFKFGDEDIKMGYERYLLRNSEEYKSEVPLSLDQYKALMYEAYGLSGG